MTVLNEIVGNIIQVGMNAWGDMRLNDSNIINTLEIVYHISIALMLTSNIDIRFETQDGMLSSGVQIHLWCLTDQINLVMIKLGLREIKMKVCLCVLKCIT